MYSCCNRGLIYSETTTKATRIYFHSQGGKTEPLHGMLISYTTGMWFATAKKKNHFKNPLNLVISDF